MMDVIKVVITDKENFLSDLTLEDIPCQLIEFNQTQHEQVRERLQDAHIVVTHRTKFDRATLEELPKLRMITTNSTGYETIDIATCQELGITVCNVRDWCTNSVVEHILSFIFSLNRQLPAYDRTIKEQGWVTTTASSYALLHPIRKEIAGSVLGIIGYGTLGKHLAKVSSALGMIPLIAERKGASPVREGYQPFYDVLSLSDIIVLLAPYTPSNQYMISTSELATMKTDAFLINCGRGGLVDEMALLAALTNGTLAGAALDVLEEEPPKPDNPLLFYKGNNLLLSSYTAFASTESLSRNSAIIVDNVRSYINGNPINVVV